MKNIDGKHRFRFQETFNNTDGKTSGSGFCGVMIVLSGIIAFLGASTASIIGIPEAMPLIPYITGYVTVGAGLLTARKLKKEI